MFPSCGVSSLFICILAVKALLGASPEHDGKGNPSEWGDWNSESPANVVKALQQVFYDMQYGNKPASIEPLTNAVR